MKSFFLYTNFWKKAETQSSCSLMAKPNVDVAVRSKMSSSKPRPLFLSVRSFCHSAKNRIPCLMRSLTFERENARDVSSGTRASPISPVASGPLRYYTRFIRVLLSNDGEGLLGSCGLIMAKKRNNFRNLARSCFEMKCGGWGGGEGRFLEQSYVANINWPVSPR